MTKAKKTVAKKKPSNNSGNAVYSTNPSKELKKVTWPNRDTLLKSTVLILFISFVLTLYVSALDIAFEKLFYFLRSIRG